MPTIVNVAIRLDKVMKFSVQAGFTPDSIANFKPTKEDQEQQSRRERMWGVNFLRRAMKGAYPDKETYSYFRKDEGTASGFGGASLQLPALGIILANRKRFRKIQTSVCASQCGIILPAGFQLQIEYSWAFAEERAKQGDTSRISMLPGMTEAERQDAGQAAGPVPAKAIEAARESMASYSSSRNPKTKAAPPPSSLG